jgi:predicted alpha/beta superfamily hydrolase
MTNVSLVYSMLAAADPETTGTWNSVPLTTMGPGLRTGEWRHVVEGVGTEGEWMRFKFNGLRNGSNTWEGTWDERDYWSPLDAMIVRDWQVFNYVPPSNGVSGSRVITTNVGSFYEAEGVYGRDVRIYLPRGYNENPDRYYPVVYMSDGSNVFQPGGTYGCWNADWKADEEIAGGRMRETIIVGVPCAHDEVARTVEYLPPMDTNSGQKGKADLYAKFLIDNVRLTIDTHYRTKNDRMNTGCIGSSSGGLLSMYLGTWTNVFGLVGAMSGVYNQEFCPNYMAWLASAQPHEARVWMDVGNVGSETNIDGLSLYDSNFELYWHLMGFGYVPNTDLHFMIGCGDNHNETAWAERLPYVYRFLLDVREEANPLLPLEMAPTGSIGQVTFPVYGGTVYSIERADALTNGWNGVTNWARETQPWSERTVVLPAIISGFYRVRGE